MTIRWITPLLGTAPASVVRNMTDISVVDVRDMVDKAGNRATVIREKIEQGRKLLAEGKKTVVCCDHGISRSNAIAAGILAKIERIPLDAAVRRVLETTGETEVRLDVVDAVRQATEPRQLTGDGREHWLLTGGHGYLGSILTATAPEGIELLRPDRRELDLLRGGVALDLYVRAHRVTRVLHFAAPRVGNTNLSIGESATMLRNVLDACAGSKIPLFLTSRWEVFGGYKDQILTADEETPTRPAGVIGDAKFLAEKLVEVWSAREAQDVTLLRSGLVFGHGGAPNFIRSFIRRTIQGDPITTHIYANGPPQLDLIHSSDWAQACWRLLLSRKTGIFHLGGGELLSTLKIAEIIVKSCGGDAAPNSILIDGRSSNVLLGSGKLERSVGWRRNGEVAIGLAEFARSLADEYVFQAKG